LSSPRFFLNLRTLTADTVYSTFRKALPHLHVPDLSEIVLHEHPAPQLQTYNPFRLTLLTALPQPHFVGSVSLILQWQSLPHVQRMASSFSIFKTCIGTRSLPQLHLPGFVDTVLHLQWSPQLQT
jgi:hypothetical protein